jgi:S-DNA-T family DNA segregation ATPase FtsK/SpoIIIE
MPLSLRRRRISRPRQYAEPEPEVVQEEVKRPPLYYFEEVEEKRARERELLASWYQPIPEPESPIATKPLTPPASRPNRQWSQP